VAEANALITTVPAPEAVERLGDGGVVFVDLREPDELSRLGWIPGAVHVPRGLLEFRIDSERPELRAAFHSGRRVLFYCAAGGRSALATRTAMVMGVEDVAHIGGGFRAWVEAGGPVARSGSQP
jgi:rhodanese-related sulfurtransferase